MVAAAGNLHMPSRNTQGGRGEAGVGLLEDVNLDGVAGVAVTAVVTAASRVGYDKSLVQYD